MKSTRSQVILNTLVLMFVTLSGAACTAEVPPSRNQSPVVTPSSGVLNSPLSTTVLVIPTPSKPDRVTITGVLLQDVSAPRPVSGVILYLASVLPDSAGQRTLAGVDKTSSPRTITDGSGRFVFADVPAATYSLVLDRITDSYLLNNPTGSGDLLFEPKPGQVLDVGKLVYSSLPAEGSAP